MTIKEAARMQSHLPVVGTPTHKVTKLSVFKHPRTGRHFALNVDHPLEHVQGDHYKISQGPYTDVTVNLAKEHVKNIKESVDMKLDETMATDLRSPNVVVPKGKMVQGKSYGSIYSDDEDDASEGKPSKTVTPSDRGRGRPKKDTGATGKAFTFPNTMNKWLGTNKPRKSFIPKSAVKMVKMGEDVDLEESSLRSAVASAGSRRAQFSSSGMSAADGRSAEVEWHAQAPAAKKVGDKFSLVHSTTGRVSSHASEDEAMKAYNNMSNNKGVKIVKEDKEQLDELSPKTLKSYIGKAAMSAADAGSDFGYKKATADEVDRFTNRNMKNQFKKRDDLKGELGVDSKSTEKVREKSLKRINGVSLAADKLVRKIGEDMEIVLEKVGVLKYKFSIMENDEEIYSGYSVSAQGAQTIAERFIDTLEQQAAEVAEGTKSAFEASKDFALGK